MDQDPNKLRFSLRQMEKAVIIAIDRYRERQRFARYIAIFLASLTAPLLFYVSAITLQTVILVFLVTATMNTFLWWISDKAMESFIIWRKEARERKAEKTKGDSQ